MKQSPFLRAYCESLKLRPVAGVPLETLVEAEDLGALPISPAQRALLRAASGQPVEHLSAERVRFHFGVDGDRVDISEKPKSVFLNIGVRGGKSRIAAFCLLDSALNCKFRREPEHADERPGPDGLVGVQSGELVRALIVAPKLGLSRAPLYHLKGAMHASPRLASLIAREGAEYIEIRRPDGAIVRVELVAASHGGDSLRSTWLAGVLFDEADYFGAEDAKVNLLENYRSVRTRVLPGGQILLTSSPWFAEAPFSLMFRKEFGKPGGRTLAFHSDSLSMNPTLDRAEIAAERAKDPDNAAREYDAIPVSSGSKAFFPEDVLKRCIDEEQESPLPFDPAFEHLAAGDLAFTRNSSALAIARAEENVMRIVYWEEQRPRPGEPLIASEVCEGFALKCAEYGTFDMLADHWNIEFAREAMRKVRMRDPRDRRMKDHERAVSITTYNPGTELEPLFTRARTYMAEGRVKLPNLPRLLFQLRSIRAEPKPGGRTRIDIPTVNGAHGDLAIACVLAIARFEDNSYRRKLGEIKKRREELATKKTAREVRDEAALERMRRMTKMPKGFV